MYVCVFCFLKKTISEIIYLVSCIRDCIKLAKYFNNYLPSLLYFIVAHFWADRLYFRREIVVKWPTSYCVRTFEILEREVLKRNSIALYRCYFAHTVDIRLPQKMYANMVWILVFGFNRSMQICKCLTACISKQGHQIFESILYEFSLENPIKCIPSWEAPARSITIQITDLLNESLL